MAGGNVAAGPKYRSTCGLRLPHLPLFQPLTPLLLQCTTLGVCSARKAHLLYRLFAEPLKFYRFVRGKIINFLGLTVCIFARY